MLFIFSTPEFIRHPWQLKTFVLLHWCLICTVPLACLICSDKWHLIERHEAKVIEPASALPQDEDSRRRNDLGGAAGKGGRGRKAFPSRTWPHRRSGIVLTKLTKFYYPNYFELRHPFIVKRVSWFKSSLLLRIQSDSFTNINS
jgi:hypothetical protein